MQVVRGVDVAIHNHAYRAVGNGSSHDGCADSLGAAGHDNNFIF